MIFRITGTSKENGARMTLEFEAPSKADAERRAEKQGMYSPRAEAIGGTAPVHAPPHTTKSPFALLILLILIAAATALYILWPQIKPLIPGLK